jgi:hypothetical protein
MLQVFINAHRRAGRYHLDDDAIFRHFIDDLGVKTIGDYFEQEDPSCHGVAHDLGKVVGERVPDLATGMQVCGSTCTYACVHGVFKVYFSRLGKEYHAHDSHESASHYKRVVLSNVDLDNFGREVNNACSKSETVVPDFFRGNCAHGVGHAMAMLASTVRLATEYCRVFEGKMMRYYCETGVFMEKAGAIDRQYFTTAPGRMQRIDQVLQYCFANSDTPSACMRFLLSRIRGLDEAKAFASRCDEESGALRRGCFNALGFVARSYVAGKPEHLESVCGIGDNLDQHACISGVAFMKKGQRHRSAIEAACHQVFDKAMRQACHKQLTVYYYETGNPLWTTLF